MGGIEAIPRLIEANPDGRVLVFTAYDTDERVLGALRAGAKGYLLKGASAEEIARSIRVVAAGETALAPRVAATLVSEVSGLRGAGPLTAREREVLRLIAAGHAQQADRPRARDQRAHGQVPRHLAPAQAGRRKPRPGRRPRRRARAAGRSQARLTRGRKRASIPPSGRRGRPPRLPAARAPPSSPLSLARERGRG